MPLRRDLHSARVPEYLIEHLAPGWRVHFLREYTMDRNYVWSPPTSWTSFADGQIRIWHVEEPQRAPGGGALQDALANARSRLPAHISSRLVHVVELDEEATCIELAVQLLPPGVLQMMAVWPGLAPGTCRVRLDELGEHYSSEDE